MAGNRVRLSSDVDLKSRSSLINRNHAYIYIHNPDAVPLYTGQLRRFCATCSYRSRHLKPLRTFRPLVSHRVERESITRELPEFPVGSRLVGETVAAAASTFQVVGFVVRPQRHEVAAFSDHCGLFDPT